MVHIQGEGISGGIVCGPLYFYKPMKELVEKKIVLQTQGECERIENALAQTILFVQRKQHEELTKDEKLLLEAYVLILRDGDLRDLMLSIVKEERCNAEYAVQKASEEFAAMFEKMEDALLRSRGADVRDTGKLVLEILLGRENHQIKMDEPGILAARELSPSEVIRFRQNAGKDILGIVLEEGDAISHAMILTKSFGIPVMIQTGNGLEDMNGLQAFLNGTEGKMCIDPDEEALQSYLSALQKEQEQKEKLRTFIGKETISSSGRRVFLTCNVNSLSELSLVKENDGEGIGLFRTEFIPPQRRSEEEQFLIYKEVLEFMGGAPVTIRLFDFGADKGEYRSKKGEKTGEVRGMEYLLQEPDLLYAQIRALLRASVFGTLSILLPGVQNQNQIDQFREIVDTVKMELKGDRIPFYPGIRIGIMIETEEILEILEKVIPCVDFISIGTNDLCRIFGKKEIVRETLRVIGTVAKEKGVPVSICGDMAGDLECLSLYSELEISELSVVPQKILPIRCQIALK